MVIPLVISVISALTHTHIHGIQYNIVYIYTVHILLNNHNILHLTYCIRKKAEKICKVIFKIKLLRYNLQHDYSEKENEKQKMEHDLG